MKNRRCFISIDLPDKAISKIKKIQDKIKKENLFDGKFIEQQNLHLTLKFLGEIDEEKIEQVTKKLEEIHFKELEGVLDSVGAFSKKIIRIIWIELKGLDKLQKEIDEKLKVLFEKENRFMGHITIARVKNVSNKNKLLNFLNNINSEKFKFEIDKFLLKSSELFSDGPVYKIIKK